MNASSFIECATPGEGALASDEERARFRAIVREAGDQAYNNHSLKRKHDHVGSSRDSDSRLSLDTKRPALEITSGNGSRDAEVDAVSRLAVAGQTATIRSDGVPLSKKRKANSNSLNSSNNHINNRTADLNSNNKRNNSSMTAPTQRPADTVMELSTHAQFALKRIDEISSKLAEVCGPPGKHYHRQLGDAVRLPLRNKTHWDHVMNEMHYMSTDYTQERSWKISTARLISQSIIHEETTALPQNDKDSASKKSVNNASSPIKISQSFAIPPFSLYDNPTTDDIDAIRDITQCLSVHLLDYWHPARDATLEKDCAVTRYNAMQDGLCMKHECEPTMKKQRSMESSNRQKELAFQEISQTILSALDKINAIQKSIDKSMNQSHAAAFIESLWKINNFSNHCLSISAILGGDYGCGKTFTACRLMKEREGRALVLCPPGSTVSFRL